MNVSGRLLADLKKAGKTAEAKNKFDRTWEKYGKVHRFFTKLFWMILDLWNLLGRFLNVALLMIGSTCID